MKNGWVETRFGIKYHYVNDVIHNDDGPARIWPYGRQEYYQHGKLHREDGPAKIWPNGCQIYFHHGKVHHENGPAKIWPDGRCEYHLFDLEVTKSHLAVMGLDDYPPNGFTKEQVMLFQLLCMGD